MNTTWKLKEFMEAHRIKPGELARHTHGRLSRTGIYGLLRDERPQNVHFGTLDALLPALSKLTGKEVGVEDLIAYQPPQPPAQRGAWRKLIGALDDPDSPGDIAERHDHYLGEAQGQEHDKSNISGER